MSSYKISNSMVYGLSQDRSDNVYLLFLLSVSEIPHWLVVYSQASQELDHKLRWEMFRLPELDCFDAMLKRLYKQELEEIVMRYEAYRYKK